MTQDLYKDVMGSRPSRFVSCGPNCPVERVTWHDAVAFANALSKREGLEQCYDTTGPSVAWPKGTACIGYRLPTEAEWEVAARGGDEAKYAGGNAVAAVAWYSENSSGTPHAVATKKANGFGLYDMSGNVWEWVWDWYGAYATAAETDPTGPPSATRRGMRGGSWGQTAPSLLVSFRFNEDPAYRSPEIGLRLVRTVP